MTHRLPQLEPFLSTCLCGWTCVSSCRTSGGTSSRRTGTGRAVCRSGWASAWTEWTTSWSFCRRSCSRSSFPETRCAQRMRLSHDFATPTTNNETGARQADGRCEMVRCSVCVCWGGGGGDYLRVHGFVLLQADRVPERFAADFTREWPSAAVRSADVHLQSVRRWEHLVERFLGENFKEGCFLNKCGLNCEIIHGPQTHFDLIRNFYEHVAHLISFFSSYLIWSSPPPITPIYQIFMVFL